MNRTRLLLVRHAPTTATRTFRFPADEPLDDDGRQAASCLAGTLQAGHAVTSPAIRCRDTAALAGFLDAAIDPDLAELDFGAWAGRDIGDVERGSATALAFWYADPTRAPHGGETLDELATRISRAIDRLRDQPGTTVAFTHGGPIKVAILHALGAPLRAIWRIDVTPCHVTELHPRPHGGWAVARANAALVSQATTAARSLPQ